MPTRPRLVVTQNEHGRFLCREEGATGACIQGDGASVLEAVGCWAVYSRTVTTRCAPPELLRKFSVSFNHKDLEFEKADERD